MSPPRSALLRSAALGLVGGSLAGAIFLAVKAVLLSRAECDPGNDCVLEAELASDLSRLHLWAAVGLLALGAALARSLGPKKPGPG